MRHGWSFTVDQLGELELLAKHSPLPYVRVKAIALCHLAWGRTAQEAAEAVFAHRVSVGQWAKRYLQQGAPGLYIAPGRGHFSKADRDEIEGYLQKSPREFGVARTRWTLTALVECVPCLGQMSPSGAHRVLERLGFGFKRGQPRLHSPDPQYEEKRGRSLPRLAKPESVREK
jgi:transposase